jgi:hypothetical protein
MTRPFSLREGDDEAKTGQKRFADFCWASAHLRLRDEGHAAAHLRLWDEGQAARRNTTYTYEQPIQI